MNKAINFFKTAIAASIFAAASTAAVADTKDFSISVAADIPTTTFFVTAAPGWSPSDVQNFGHNNGVLQAITRPLDMKSTIGAIKAYLLNTAEMKGTNTNKIAIDVSVNGKKLAVGPANTVEVMDKTAAAAGQRVALSLTPNTATPATGVYSGQVALVFESNV